MSFFIFMLKNSMTKEAFKMTGDTEVYWEGQDMIILNAVDDQGNSKSMRLTNCYPINTGSNPRDISQFETNDYSVTYDVSLVNSFTKKIMKNLVPDSKESE